MARREVKKTIERFVEAPSKLAEDTEQRVVKLESQYDNLQTSINDVKEEVKYDIGEVKAEVKAVGNSLSRVGKPQWGVVVSFSSLIFAMLATGGGAGFTILKMSSDHGNELRSIAITFQDKINDARFKEVETQFKGVTSELETQIRHNSESNMKTELSLSHINTQLDAVEVQQTKNTQWREDLDKYGWPSIKPKQ